MNDAHIEMSGSRWSWWNWAVVFGESNAMFLMECSGATLTRRGALRQARRAYRQLTKEERRERVEIDP